MIYGFSHFDAYTSLFLQRPWQYLHQSLGLSPPLEKNTSISRQVYERGPFPYQTLSLVLGWDGKNRRMLLNTNLDPRAFVLSNVTPPGANQTARMPGGDPFQIHRGAQVEPPRPLLIQGGLEAKDSTVKLQRFEPNSILLDVDARDDALLVLSEAWYPGWRAKVDGEEVLSIPAHGWMRAFPLRAGRHRVKIFFRQNYLALGGAFSGLGAALLCLAFRGRKGAAKPAGQIPGSL